MNTNERNQTNAEDHTACGVWQGQSSLGVRAMPACNLLITRRLTDVAVCAGVMALQLQEQRKHLGRRLSTVKLW